MAEFTLDQQRAIARARARRRAQSQPGAVGQFGQEANVGIANTLGAPVDMVSSGLRAAGLPIPEDPVGGSAQIRRAFEGLGIAPPEGAEGTDTVARAAGRFTGEVAPLLPVVGAAAPAARGAQSVGGRVVRSITDSAVRRPGRFAAIELGAASGAGALGELAGRNFPDAPASRFIGEIIGGVGVPLAAGGVAAISPTISGARMARRALSKLTGRGTQLRVEQRFRDVTADTESARRGLVEEDAEALPGLRLTPAQETGDPGLLALERSIIESSETLKKRSDEQIQEANRVIREALQEPGQGVPVEASQDALSAMRRDYMESLLDTRVRVAARKAQERIEEVGPTISSEKANMIAKEELDNALKAARKQESNLWSKVPDSEISIENTGTRFDEIIADTPSAQRGDIPEIARRFLRKSGEGRAIQPTIKEMQGLRSKLLEESRKARLAGDNNKARISEDLAQSILDDLGAARRSGGVTNEPLRAALDFSFDLNERFTRGPIGVLMRRSRQRGGIGDTLTLEETVGVGGPRAAVETRALMRAMERSGDSPAMQQAVTEFLKDRFQQSVAPKGEINETAARRFMQRNRDVLEQFPQLRDQFNEAINTGRMAGITRRTAGGAQKRLSDPRFSRAAVFIGQNPDTAVNRVFISRRPVETMREIAKEARRDPTNQAISGLKTGVMDFIIDRAKKGIDDAGNPIISGRNLIGLINNKRNRQVLSEVFSPQEMKRLQTIANKARKLEMARDASPVEGGALGSRASGLARVIAGIGGAQLGRLIAKLTGGGTVQTPGLVASTFRRASDKISGDPAERLLSDAIQNKRLFRALLEADVPFQDASPFVRRQLNGWLLSLDVPEIGERREPKEP